MDFEYVGWLYSQIASWNGFNSLITWSFSDLNPKPPITGMLTVGSLTAFDHGDSHCFRRLTIIELRNKLTMGWLPG